MKFMIYTRAQVYGGLPNQWVIIHAHVSQDFVLGFFSNVEIDRSTSKHGVFRTAEDSMGCCDEYRIEVSELP